MKFYAFLIFCLTAVVALPLEEVGEEHIPQPYEEVGEEHIPQPYEEFFAESVRPAQSGFNSIRCANYDQILNNNCVSSGANARMGGEPSNIGRGVNGVYFLTTNAQSPFARAGRTERYRAGDGLRIVGRCPSMSTTSSDVRSAARLRASTVRGKRGLSHRCAATQQASIGHNHLHVSSIGGRHGVRLSERKQWTSRIERNHRVQAAMLTLAGITGHVCSQAEPNHVHVVHRGTSSQELIDKGRQSRTGRSDRIPCGNFGLTAPALQSTLMTLNSPTLRYRSRMFVFMPSLPLLFQPWMVKRVGCPGLKLEAAIEPGLPNSSTCGVVGLVRVNRRKIKSCSGLKRGAIEARLSSGRSYGLVLTRCSRPSLSGTRCQFEFVTGWEATNRSCVASSNRTARIAM
uniref:Uncharacterized protein n=1 Tax=Anopheles farauti TaxID=69004 RepID=A0A182PZH4_9DIPT